MTKLTTRYLEVSELPDDFDIQNTAALKKALGDIYLKAFVHRGQLYRLDSKDDAGLYKADLCDKNELIKVGQLMPKDFRVEVISSEGEAAAKLELAKANDRIERLTNAMSDLKDRSFNEKFVLKAIAAANGHDL